MKRLLIVLALLMPACGPPRIDSEFLPYVRAFEREGGVTVASDMGFKELKDNLVGLCQPDLIRNQIWVDPRMWEATEGDEAAREIIVFHELGHCELSRPHDNRKDRHGAPLSIMYRGPLTQMIQPYAEKREEYISELFAR